MVSVRLAERQTYKHKDNNTVSLILFVCTIVCASFLSLSAYLMLYNVCTNRETFLDQIAQKMWSEHVWGYSWHIGKVIWLLEWSSNNWVIETSRHCTRVCDTVSTINQAGLFDMLCPSSSVTFSLHISSRLAIIFAFVCPHISIPPNTLMETCDKAKTPPRTNSLNLLSALSFFFPLAVF